MHLSRMKIVRVVGASSYATYNADKLALAFGGNEDDQVKTTALLILS